MMNRLLTLLLLSLLVSCGGGGGGSGGQDGGDNSANFGCDGSCGNLSLSSAEVTRILSQAVAGAQQLSVAGTIAVTDRVGNVLGVYRMAGAPTTTSINGQIGAVGGLEGLAVPATLAAISKAGTGAYLSSQGNAFSSRTASQIVQENFNPGERRQGGGPLFGVQFSQLPCSDVTLLDAGAGGSRKGGGLSVGGHAGPRPLPLGLSADPGGIPLYKNGDLVGGVGVEFDGLYTLDRDVNDFDDDPEERVALVASRGFEAPSERTAPNISVGKYLRYTDLTYHDLEALPPALPELNPSSIVAVPPYFNGTIRSGAVFGTPSSGIANTVRAGVPASILTAGGAGPRFPTRSGTNISASEVDALLDSTLITASRTRAAIRRPLDTGARVSIWVVDESGNALGFIRSQDAPVFGIDVALQKARTAALFSRADAGARLSRGGFGGYVAGARGLMGGDAFANGRALTARAIGNISRPFFPDGINGTGNGPFSRPFPGTASGASWSPFNTGLQLDLVVNNLAASLGGGSIPSTCGNQGAFGKLLGNGIQIFPGAVPLYRGNILIGGLGISGDGIDQDDLIAFYGASRRGLDRAGHSTVGDAELGFNAPLDIRSDQIPLAVEDTRLRYVNCPEAPFSGDNDQNVCEN